MKKDKSKKDKSYKFSIRIVKFFQFVSTQKKEFLISKQVLRSGTSIGAMIEEPIRRKVRLISFTNFRLQIRKRMKPIIG